MLHKNLLNPKNIVVVGASNNVHTPGGNVLKNLIDHNFKGQLIAVNPKETEVQGVKCYQNIIDIPNVDLAIIAISAKFTLETIIILTQQKNTKGFIIFSAGFSEKDEAGALIEQQIVDEINAVGGTLLGPNNIGLINTNYAGVFTTPIPKLNPKGVDFISGSGATAVFIMEAAMSTGLTFSSVYSVGNSALIGVEDVLEHFDKTFDSKTSSKVKLLYIESIENPQKLLKHAASLINKGCKIAAIKAGSSDEGSRAASSHTGALANSDVAVDALFKKAGIIRCYGKNELITVASIFMHPELKGKNIAIITHAGGPAVMLTDALSKNGLNVPEIKNQESEELLTKLYPGSSVSNPIDFLATGTAEQLETIIDYCEQEFTNIDAMVVIFGSPGLFEVYDVYDVLHNKMQTCSKPIFPILPSVVNVKKEIDYFISKGNINFPDEVLFGNALTKIYNTTKPTTAIKKTFEVDRAKIRSIINNNSNGYLHPQQVKELLVAAEIPIVSEMVCNTKEECLTASKTLGFPLVIKVVGPVHKSDVGGIILNISSKEKLYESFEKIMQVKGATSVLLQPMKKGIELFIGAKREGDFGHLVLCGLGGIYIEVLNDVNTSLAPVSQNEALEMIRNLKSYKIIQGVRNQEGVNESLFAEIVTKISNLVTFAPEIIELDLNPLLGNSKEILAVDARVRIQKN
ncbi:MAG: acetate--CoA ligase family protein [Lutibacter sp.]|uniref:acetate--CoA ligase family protein n=1 Tax=Lutibacter sp. TaxID=1925666 RepID=UPI001830C243|nr:acetate--CoA ligase family protein [Lutibacter sp.]MBT8317435.1 acetate--CoA ligase family protein [Lutibacter sp.]NNJ58294.1 acetate--CoA ligase family protein [Lutibacter sp.]